MDLRFLVKRSCLCYLGLFCLLLRTIALLVAILQTLTSGSGASVNAEKLFMINNLFDVFTTAFLLKPLRFGDSLCNFYLILWYLRSILFEINVSLSLIKLDYYCSILYISWFSVLLLKLWVMPSYFFDFVLLSKISLKFKGNLWF